ncbi:hypothetical protein FKW77_006514 [Venturia effusa]|uniref:Zn(2)-C6 fungal-type domain-containing protein n=1 Tax=Venturia effusa TaxID=50376 RepID=A0A517L3L7_9PEZI|nr:hypothetical protein FKW77_006514 [Venturia effusa]
MAGQNMASSQDLTTETNDKASKEASTSTAAQKRQKSRHRASVACASCRDRRIRCVVPAGDSECTQCKRSGIECVIKNDDERRRPISRAYMCSLTERVALLENMLKEQGASPPPANHPPMTRHGPRPEDASPSRKYHKSQGSMNIAHSNQDHSSPGSQHDDYMDGDLEQHHTNRSQHIELDRHSHQGEDGQSIQSASTPSVLAPSIKEDGMVKRLLSTRGHLSFDQLSGRLRYFGPTTNCHVHSDQIESGELSREAAEQTRRAEKAIRFLSEDTYEYLMDLFWQHYNTTLHVLHKDSFYEQRETGRTQFYSGFLHICVLAMGYRFADKSRHDMQRITLQGKESTLHREAKYMLDSELERPGGIPSVVALLLLGDLECGVGRDNVGWLYSGMAVRIAFDIGLHLDTRLSGLPEREVEIRRMTLWACVIYDKYWALFLGRPTSMKSSDLEVYHLSKQFERLGTCLPAGPEKALETQIYEALLDLMELAGKITENMDPRSQTDAAVDRDAYLRMAALDREFGNWYARLPDALKWTPLNINTAPFSFFTLHQQYHAALILLHRPFAMYEEPSGPDSEDSHSPDNHFSALSRTVCTKHAIRVARIFWQHRQRFDTKQICVTGLQHAGTAATALVAALAFIKDANDRNNNMQYLECLSASLQDMSQTYQPAERMFLVLQAVLTELRGAPDDNNNFHRPKGVMVPARRSSTCVDDMDPPTFTKRRQVARAYPKSKPPPVDHRPSIDPTLSSDHNMHHRKQSQSDSDRMDGFVMVTPQSEISNWSIMNTDNTSNSLAPAQLMQKNPSNAWMTGNMDDHGIEHLATVHFPELNDLGGGGADDGHTMTGHDSNTAFDNDGAGGNAANANRHLDFMNLGGDEWKDWQPNGTGDLDGFPPLHSFSAAFSPGKFEQSIAVGFGNGG